ncbi:protein FAM227B [Amia ocellicauda]|uniref:protein FAM227B n=1 Tax=Amia ocellicauda TaxID=2972642 RepID=UPI003463B390
MEKPPRDLAEFLRFQNLVDWPIALDESVQLRKQLDGYSSPDDIADRLHKEAPMETGIIISLEQRVEVLSSQVENHAAKILSCQTTPLRTDDQPAGVSPQLLRFLKKTRRNLRKKNITSQRNKDIEGCKFPGFTLNEWADLPGQLDALLLMNCISENQNYTPGFLNIWKPFFLSKASVAVFKDAFWWFYLHTFKPNQEDEDRLFDRIAESFVALLITVELDVKDRLFKVYADCLTQAVYSVFYEAFPESRDCIDEQFKTELTDLISHWVTGMKPFPFTWKKWKLNWLCQLANGASEMEKEYKTFSAVNGTQSQMNFNLEELIRNTRTMSVVQTESSAAKRGSTATTDVKIGDFSRKLRESHYIGPGPEFQHVLFRMAGQSPLVAHYLQLRGIPCTAGADRHNIKRTEICKLPPLVPTYRDVIGEARQFSNKLLQDYTQ